MFQSFIIIKCCVCGKKLLEDKQSDYGPLDIRIHIDVNGHTYDTNKERVLLPGDGSSLEKYLLCDSCHKKFNPLDGIMPKPLHELEE